MGIVEDSLQGGIHVHVLAGATPDDDPSSGVTTGIALASFMLDTNRRENITGWALNKFRSKYANKRVTNWHISYYVYALLYHPVTANGLPTI